MAQSSRLATGAGALVLALSGPMPDAAAQAPSTIQLLPPGGAAAGPQGWTVAQLQSLLTAAQHTAGDTGFEFKSVTYRSEPQARLASFSGLPKTIEPRTVGNLVEAHPALRRTVSGLYRPGSRSKAFPATLSTGERVWVVVELVRRFPARVRLEPGPEFEAWAQRMVSTGNLPSPARLALDPLERVRRAWWSVRSADAVAEVPQEFDANVRFGDESTPLVRAILRRDLASTRALLDRGADPNLCAPLGCPLSVAHAVAPDFLAWLDLLRARGGKLDAIDADYAGAGNTLLATAILAKDDGLTRRLMELGASPDGVPGVVLTPLQAAVAMGRRDLAEEMLRAGARPLSFPDRAEAPPPVLRYNIYQAALETNDDKLVAWAEDVSIAAGKADKSLGYRVAIEQDGKPVAAGADGVHTLRAAAFSLVVHFEDAKNGDVQVGGSLSPRWVDEVRSGDRRNAMFRPFSAGASAEPPSEDSYELFVGDPCPANLPKDGSCEGSFIALHADPAVRVDFHSVRKDRQEWVREVRAVVNTSARTAGPSVPVTQLKGQTLYLVASNSINLGTIDGLRLLAPTYLQLRFR